MWAEKALEVARVAHAGQVDKGGAPYILHPMAVADGVCGDTAKAVALLHDVAEDTSITIEDLTADGFPGEITEAVRVLTKRPGIDYETYLLAVKQNPVARTVKLADLRHNMDTKRLGRTLTDEDHQRLAKYRAAVDYLA